MARRKDKKSPKSGKNANAVGPKPMSPAETDQVAQGHVWSDIATALLANIVVSILTPTIWTTLDSIAISPIVNQIRGVLYFVLFAGQAASMTVVAAIGVVISARAIQGKSLLGETGTWYASAASRASLWLSKSVVIVIMFSLILSSPVFIWLESIYAVLFPGIETGIRASIATLTALFTSTLIGVIALNLISSAIYTLFLEKPIVAIRERIFGSTKKRQKEDKRERA